MPMRRIKANRSIKVRNQNHLILEKQITIIRYQCVNELLFSNKKSDATSYMINFSFNVQMEKLHILQLFIYLIF